MNQFNLAWIYQMIYDLIVGTIELPSSFMVHEIAVLLTWFVFLFVFYLSYRLIRHLFKFIRRMFI